MNHPLNKFFALFAFLSALTCATSAFAENFYVAQAATGSGTGASAANAKAVTFFNTAANWSSPTKVAGKIGPGDTVRLTGTLSTALAIQASGTASSPITVVFEPGAKLSKPYWGQDTGAAITASSKNYIVIDGANAGIIECTANGIGLGNIQPATGIYLKSSNNIEVKNLTIQNIFVNTYNSTGGISAYAAQCIKALDCSNLSVHNNVLNNAYMGVYCLTDYAITLSNTNIYNNTCSSFSTAIIVALAASGSYFDQVNIYGNDITMGLNWYDTPNYNHIDGIHCWGTTGGAITNLKIHSNYIHGNPSTHCSGFIFLESTVTAPMIYNNLLVGSTNAPAEGYIDLSLQGPASFSVYNNTIVGTGTGTGLTFYSWTTATGTIKNNIFKSLNMGIFAQNGTPTIISDYNNFYSVGTVARRLSVSSASLATWQTSGNDLHSIATDPRLNADFTLPTSSPAATIGTSLISLFSADKAGNPRSASGAWGMGCYVAGGAANPVIIPPSSAITAIIVF